MLKIDLESIDVKILSEEKRNVVVSINSFKTLEGKIYPFKEPGLTLELTKDPYCGKWNCCCPHIKELSSYQGLTLRIALYRWCLGFYKEFELVRNKRPFEQNEEEKKFCSKLRQYFDYRLYQDLNPLSVVRYGVVVELFEQDCVIAWENGDQETFKLQRLPDEFKTVVSGDKIHASVDIDFNTGNGIRITEVYNIEKKEN